MINGIAKIGTLKSRDFVLVLGENGYLSRQWTDGKYATWQDEYGNAHFKRIEAETEGGQNND